MLYLSQRDPRWAQQKLGKSNLTVGRYGCTTTAISMLTSYFGKFIDPLNLAHQQDLYTGDGLILWKNLRLPSMDFAWRSYVRNDGEIKAALRDKDKAVILEVDNKSHWVTALRPTLYGNSYIVLDPWDGKKVDVIKRYKNITGAAFFRRKA